MLTITIGLYWLVEEFVEQAEEIPKTQILLTSKEWKVISCLKSAKFGKKYFETGFERNRNCGSHFYSRIHDAKHNRMKSHWFFSLISQESWYEFHGIEKPQKSLHSICTCVECPSFDERVDSRLLLFISWHRWFSRISAE